MINDVDLYSVEILGSDLINKNKHPGILAVPPFDPKNLLRLAKHPGEKFVYILEGGIIVFSEDYKPTELNEGDSIYLDSSSGHHFVSKNRKTARILVVCSNTIGETAEIKKIEWPN